MFKRYGGRPQRLSSQPIKKHTGQTPLYKRNYYKRPVMLYIIPIAAIVTAVIIAMAYKGCWQKHPTDTTVLNNHNVQPEPPVIDSEKKRRTIIRDKEKNDTIAPPADTLPPETTLRIITDRK